MKQKKATIDDVIASIYDKNKRFKAAKVFAGYESQFIVNKGSHERHHVYAGGLNDHVVLTALICYAELKSFPPELALLYNFDDVIISVLFHDFDKIGMYDGQEPAFSGMDEVIEMLADEGLLNGDVTDGITHSHGGFRQDGEEHGKTSILVHHADMLASSVFKNPEETGKMIEALSKYMLE